MVLCERLNIKNKIKKCNFKMIVDCMIGFFAALI